MDHLVAACEHCGRVEPVGRQPRNAPDLGEQLTGTEERLRRHAGVVRALAADEVLLDEGDVDAGLAQPPGDDLAGRSGADHDHVEASFGHGRV